MGAYWGSRWFAVTADPLASRVEQVDLKPFGVVCTSDRVVCPTPDHLAGFESFESEADAVRAVRAHIFSTTDQAILERVVAIELLKLEIERLRILEPDNELSRSRIRERKADTEALTEELKQLRRARRAKVAVA